MERRNSRRVTVVFEREAAGLQLYESYDLYKSYDHKKAALKIN